MSTMQVHNNQVVERMRKSTWVEAGTAVNATSAASAAKQAGLDWTVSLSDMETTTLSSTGVNRLHIPNRQAVIKTHNNEQSVVGVVGTKYKLVQNMEVFNAIDTLVDSGDARYTAAGEYNGGSNVWMVLALPKGVQVAGDPHNAFLLVKTGHDGSSAVIIKPIIERLFCANQINRLIMGKNKNKYTYSMKHTTNSKLSIQDIRNITQLTYTMIDDYQTIANNLLGKEIENERAKNIFKQLWALPPEVEGVAHEFLTQGQKRQQTIAMDARKNAFDIFAYSPTQENIRNTAFGVWQAVIEHADHHAGKDTMKRSINAISGRSDKIKSKALDLVLV